MLFLSHKCIPLTHSLLSTLKENKNVALALILSIILLVLTFGLLLSLTGENLMAAPIILTYGVLLSSVPVAVYSLYKLVTWLL